MKYRIRRELAAQQEAEGSTPDTELLKAVLDCCKYRTEWQALTNVEHKSTGPLSYQSQLFYRPSPLLKRLQEHFEGNHE